MANRKRPIVLRCPVTAEERALIEQKMAQLPTQRIGAYLRKMAIDGYGKLVMLECEVFFSVPVVGIFRADMFEYRQRLHLLSARLQTSRRQGRRRLPALPFPAPGRGFRIRSGSGQSGLSCRRFSRTLP